MKRNCVGSLARAVAFVLLLLGPLCCFEWTTAAPCEVNYQSMNGKTQQLALGDGSKSLCIEPGAVVKATAGPGVVYRYRHVNVAGTLLFEATESSANLEFRAESILVEKEGLIRAGESVSKPYGLKDSLDKLHFVIYGDPDQVAHPPISCYLTTFSDHTCGIHNSFFTAAGNGTIMELHGSKGTISDHFYGYHNLDFDKGYFGTKTFAVSFGGSLELYGRLGVQTNAGTTLDDAEYAGGHSWTRLARSMKPNESVVCPEVSAKELGWPQGSHIIVTTTDFLSNHTEQFVVTGFAEESTCFTVDRAASFHHLGEVTELSEEQVPESLEIENRAVDYRAAVALLDRSIVIAAGGRTVNDPIQAPCDSPTRITDGSDNPCCKASPDPDVCSFGVHTVARQGFKKYVLSGVEVVHGGQGGRLGHYPLHFHLARDTSYTDAIIRDCSIHHSMTRFITVHGTQHVQLYRNVGFGSIGHGYFLEDGVETHNDLVSNLAVNIRGGVFYAMNERRTPGILAQTVYHSTSVENVYTPWNSLTTYSSDILFPTAFWLTNAYNNVIGNYAAGISFCGSCYWVVPVSASGPSARQEWTGYAGIQKQFAGSAPTLRFQQNTCISSKHILQSSPRSECAGFRQSHPRTEGAFAFDVAQDTTASSTAVFYSIINERANLVGTTYPALENGAGWRATALGSTTQCAPAIKDRSPCLLGRISGLYSMCAGFTETNFAALWLRDGMFLVEDVRMANILNAGITIVTAGDYTSVIPEYWSLTRQSIFIGEVANNSNPFARVFGKDSWFNYENPDGLNCLPYQAYAHCLAHEAGWSFNQNSNFAGFQRFYNIYDGPTAQERNAYIDIITAEPTCAPFPTDLAPSGARGCNLPASLFGQMNPIPRNLSLPDERVGFIPHAAIGWKQPNGFLYPPAFHSEQLAFSNVTVRHWIFNPPPGLWVGNSTFTTYDDTYVRFTPNMFGIDMSDLDRQTIVNDLDGSLTGILDSVAINRGEYFQSPITIEECHSGGSIDTNAYPVMVLAIWPPPAAQRDLDLWPEECSNSECAGPSLRRMNLLQDGIETEPPSIRMMGSATSQRSTLVLVNGTYLLDTSESRATQESFVQSVRQQPGNFRPSVFQKAKEYTALFLYATADARPTFQFYVGKNHPQISTGLTLTVRRALLPFAAPIQYEDIQQNPAYTYDLSTGVVSIQLNFSDYRDVLGSDALAVKKHKCGPPAWCEIRGHECRCAIKDKNDPNYASCSRIDGQGRDVCHFSTLHPECFSNGCLALSFKLPSTFAADDGLVVSDVKPTCFSPCSFGERYVELHEGDLLVPQKVSGSAECFYKPEQFLPPEVFCKNPLLLQVDDDIPGRQTRQESGEPDPESACVRFYELQVHHSSATTLAVSPLLVLSLLCYALIIL